MEDGLKASPIVDITTSDYYCLLISISNSINYASALLRAVISKAGEVGELPPGVYEDALKKLNQMAHEHDLITRIMLANPDPKERERQEKELKDVSLEVQTLKMSLDALNRNYNPPKHDLN